MVEAAESTTDSVGQLILRLQPPLEVIKQTVLEPEGTLVHVNVSSRWSPHCNLDKMGLQGSESDSPHLWGERCMEML